MDLRRYNAASDARGSVLLVMLAGAGIAAEDFARHGMIEAAHARGLGVDIVAARPDLDDYLDWAIAEAIDRDIIATARGHGYARIWTIGLSLGGLGALLHARAHAGSVEGIVLLSPFLGTAGMIAEVVRAGGLARWQPGVIAVNDGERQLLAWLKHNLSAPPPFPELYLGYGQADRFIAGQRLLADRLPPERVVEVEGEHDWPTWTLLWRRILDKRPFGLDKR
jgi:pimeloyl-ACP methyl ester carboxylesterase